MKNCIRTSATQFSRLVPFRTWFTMTTLTYSLGLVVLVTSAFAVNWQRITSKFFVHNVQVPVTFIK